MSDKLHDLGSDREPSVLELAAICAATPLQWILDAVANALNGGNKPKKSEQPKRRGRPPKVRK